MNINDYVNFLGEIGEYEIDELTRDGSPALEKIPVILKDLAEASESAKEILISKAGEKNLVKLMVVIQRFAVVSSVAEGRGMYIMLADVADELDSYTQTVIMATIGILIESEIL